MTREELIVYDRWLTENKWGSSEIVTPEQAADRYLTEHPLPPAEGAEEIRREYSEESMDFFRSFIKARKELCAISPTETYSLEEAIRKAFDGFFPKPLSIVDDAEKILNSHPYLKVWIENLYDSEMKVCSIEQAIWAIEKAATLHAQRIAEKMVSERLREELMTYEEWKHPSRARMLIEDKVFEYLRTREK